MFLDFFVKYSSNKIRKTQNEHVIVVWQNLIRYVVMNLKPISRLFGVYTTWFLWPEIWIQVLISILFQLTSLVFNRRDLTTAFLCWHIPIFAVAILQDMECYLIVNSKT